MIGLGSDKKDNVSGGVLDKNHNLLNFAELVISEQILRKDA